MSFVVEDRAGRLVRSRASRRRPRIAAAACLAVAGLAGGLAGCGGGDGENPFGNPPLVANPESNSGQKLSYVYFQKCINPILLAQLQSVQGGTTTTNTCASAGCHSNASGTGGALRVVPEAQALDLSNAANTAEVIRASDMYKNFYSSQGSTVPGSPLQSRMLTKPLVQGVLHGGGLIFENEQDPNARLIKYWISRPMPQGQDEFSNAANTMFTPADPQAGTCNTQ
ncbi:hypothetical protein [Rivibacter subsaxonicus]|uniref:Cytochrome c domain-containing protein n=1 Tax=Rivibacter subsaxonicus TaxID=457575 RepID=A0A4Q7W1B4_9BURK|nr:hypothetical protein [Rivibacter subsaxonicus]RZU02803.1 hypothetical protein EV670_0832 [Rivibacter subsaxonicus]